jgi:cytidylate kinase
MKRPIITIDGPSGAGKSTVSRILAQRLGYTYLDTGAMYRAVALKVLESHTDVENENEMREVLSNLTLSFKQNKDGFHVFLDGEDVTYEIRTSKISMLASAVSAKPAVRELLTDMQRQIGRKGNMVLEGRDMGTVVFPDAEVKFYLDASAEVRAHRRHREMVEKGESVEWEEVFEDVLKRDANDSNRKLSPLRPTKGAIIIDSTGLTIKEVTDKMLKMIEERMGFTQTGETEGLFNG